MTAFSTAVDAFKYSEIPTGDVDIVSTATKGCPLMSVIATQSRKRLDGQYSSELGLREKFWTKGTTYTFKEYGDFSEFYTCNATHNSSVTTLTLVSTVGIVTGQIMINTVTGEQFRVLTIPDATTITVTRGFGTTAAAAMAAAQAIILVSVSTPYGTVGTDSIEKSAVDKTNYFQKITTVIKRTDLDNFISNELSLMSWENVSNARDIFVMDKMLEHAKQIEKTLLLSQKFWDSGTSTGTPEGIIEMARRGGNVSDISGGPTLVAFVTAVKSLFLKGDPTTRYVFYGESVSAVIQTMINLYKIQAHGVAGYAIDGVDLTFQQVTLTGGEVLRFIRHPNMTTGSGYAGYGVIIDPTQLKLVYSQGRTVMGQTVKGTTQIHRVDSVSNYANEQYDIVTYITLHNANAAAHALVKFA